MLFTDPHDVFLVFDSAALAAVVLCWSASAVRRLVGPEPQMRRRAGRRALDR